MNDQHRRYQPEYCEGFFTPETQEVVNALMAVIQAFDPYTHDHCKSVAHHAALLAKALNCSQAQVVAIYYGGLFHDLGKVGIPPAILQKPNSLMPEEYVIIKEHPVKGAKILSEISGFKDIVPIVLHHHEMFDGTGYPNGLAGNDIPLGSRIVAVVDAYDALTTNRVYRKAVDRAQALEEIKNHTPQQFDPEIIAVFLGIEKNW